jgi:TolB-like protein
MICSTSSSSRALIACELLALLMLPGCAWLRGRSAPPLAFESLISEGEGPAVARSTSIRWTAASTGGMGEPRYEFRTLRGAAEIVEQEGPSPTWDWNPRRAGTFRVKVTIEDGAGDRVDSGWSSPIVVLPPFSIRDLIAVLPVDNLTGRRAPLREAGRLLRMNLNERGFRLLDDDIVIDFMKRYRIRHTGSVNSQVSRAMKEEAGADAVLVTSLEVFQDVNPPRVALFSRLVSSGETPEIAWMDGVGLSGGASPGLLALGWVDDVGILLERAVRCIADSLVESLSQTDATVGAAPRDELNECDPSGDVVAVSPDERGKRKHRPRSFFRSPMIDPNKRYSVAIIPFLNLSERRNAGSIMAFHFVDQMIRNEFFTVIEPGLVREQLLKHRIIMEAGPSLANAEILSSPGSLGADLVLSGAVFDYQDSVGVPKVDFSVKVIEKTERKVVWSSRSHNTGNEGVFFFDLGRVHTAHRLASEMAQGTFDALAR